MSRLRFASLDMTGRRLREEKKDEGGEAALILILLLYDFIVMSSEAKRSRDISSSFAVSIYSVERSEVETSPQTLQSPAFAVN
jgi:hypothetical protein